MKRFNYLSGQGAVFETFGKWRIGPELRPPLMSLMGIVALLVAIYLVEDFRLRVEAGRYDTYVHKLRASEIALRDLKRLKAHVRDLQRLTRQVDDIRSLGAQRANDLAWIGNHLPKDMWLTVLRHERAAYLLEGGAERVVSLGAGLTSLSESSGLGEPRLVSFNDDANRRSGTIRYVLRLEPRSR